jgi:homoserine dehydrogenase
MVSIAIMGHGVVGSGVAEIFTTHKQKLYAKPHHVAITAYGEHPQNHESLSSSVVPVLPIMSQPEI